METEKVRGKSLDALETGGESLGALSIPESFAGPSEPPNAPSGRPGLIRRREWPVWAAPELDVASLSHSGTGTLGFRCFVALGALERSEARVIPSDASLNHIGYLRPILRPVEALSSWCHPRAG